MSAGSLKLIAFTSFFYISWLFPKSTTERIPAEGLYFIVLLSLCGVFSFLLISRLKVRYTRTFALHALLVLACGVTLAWAPNGKVGLKQLLTWVFPLIIHLLYLSSRPGDALNSLHFSRRVILAMTTVTFGLFGVGMLLENIQFSLDSGLGDGTSGMLFFVSLDLVTIVACMLIAHRSVRPLHPLYFYGWLGACAGLLFLNFSKTYMAASLAAFLGGPILTTRRLSVKFLCLTGMLMTFILALATDNPFSRQLFWNPSDSRFIDLSSLSSLGASVNTSGRLSIWTFLLEKADNGDFSRFLGNGIGASEFFLSGSGFREAGLTPHSDYVRLFVDFGWTGVVTYVGCLLGALAYYARQATRANDWQLAFYGRLIVMILIFMLVGGIGYELLNRHRTLLFVLAALVAAYPRRKEEIALSPIPGPDAAALLSGASRACP